MNLKIILGLLIMMIIISCSKHLSNSEQKISASPKQNLQNPIRIQIENGINQGIRANAKLGISNPIIYTTSVITNESAIPLNLQFALSKEYDFPNFCSDSTYKVFLFPKELTPDSSTLTNTIVSDEDDFIKRPLNNPTTLNKTLKPGEFFVLTIGTSYSKSSNCEVVPRVVFSHTNKELYEACDTQINQAITADSQLEIGVKLEFYNQRKFIAPEDHCTVIPCGQISFTNK